MYGKAQCQAQQQIICLEWLKPAYNFGTYGCPYSIHECHCGPLVTTTTTLHPFNGFFSRTTWVSRHQKGKPFWIFLSICKSFAPCSRQITMPVPHHSVFYRPDVLPAAQSTPSKHSRQLTALINVKKLMEYVSIKRLRGQIVYFFVMNRQKIILCKN